MNQTDGSAPAWLFSFVDLAFLMLIAMTQLAPDPSAKIPNLGEMIVPRVTAAAATELGNAAHTRCACKKKGGEEYPTPSCYP